MNKLHKAAEEYIKLGFAVIPVHTINGESCSCSKKEGCSSSGKHPITKNGLNDHTKDFSVIDEWWLTWPNANVGIVTGEMSGIFVLDLDGEDAKRYAKERGLPITPIAITGKGAHVYFSIESIVPGNTSDRDFGIDIRGNGGYVVAPPSTHTSGNSYTWSHWHPWNTPLAAPPGWVLDFASDSVEGNLKNRGWQNDLLTSGVGRGGRNRAAASLAGRLLHKGLTLQETVEFLSMWNERNDPPLSQDELVRTISSIARRNDRRH